VEFEKSQCSEYLDEKDKKKFTRLQKFHKDEIFNSATSIGQKEKKNIVRNTRF